jgi:hypothetical protein
MNIEKRMKEVMQTIDKGIMLCDDENEILMMACGMLQRCREIFDLQLGEEGRKKMMNNS